MCFCTACRCIPYWQRIYFLTNLFVYHSLPQSTYTVYNRSEYIPVQHHPNVKWFKTVRPCSNWITPALNSVVFGINKMKNLQFRFTILKIPPQFFDILYVHLQNWRPINPPWHREHQGCTTFWTDDLPFFRNNFLTAVCQRVCVTLL